MENNRLQQLVRTSIEAGGLTVVLLAVSTGMSAVSPLRTKIQTYIGFPFRMYGEGVFPWPGDLEDKRVFFLGGFVLDIAFWWLVSVIVILAVRRLTRVRRGSEVDRR